MQFRRPFGRFLANLLDHRPLRFQKELFYDVNYRRKSRGIILFGSISITCLFFMRHANMYDICTYTYYRFIIHAFNDIRHFIHTITIILHAYTYMLHICYMQNSQRELQYTTPRRKNVKYVRWNLVCWDQPRNDTTAEDVERVCVVHVALIWHT